MIQAPADLAAYLATRPRQEFIADLFTITLTSGPVYRFTDWRTPVTVAGQQFLPGPPRIVRGQIKIQRGTSVDSTQIQLQEANGQFVGMAARGFFNRAVVLQQRVFTTAPGQPWMGPVTKFFGRVADISDMTRSKLTLTVKSMMNDLDNDFPRSVIMPSCDRVLYDQGCTVPSANYRTSLVAGAGSTRNKVVAPTPQAAPYFDQGFLTWTSGAMAGISYMVKTTDAGDVYPAYPFLTIPDPGDTFDLFAGCDRSQATCTSKFDNLANFTGKPFVPDPTITY